MNKTLTWILIGVLAAGALGAVAFLEFRPRPDVAAAPIEAQPTARADGGSSVAPAAALPPSSPATSPAPQAAASAAAPSDSTAPTVDALIQRATAYDGTAVSLTGTILTQCTAGCEFALDDGTGVLSVQLEGKAKDRLIPLGKVGKRIAVQGVFHASPRPQIVIEDPNGWQLVK